MSLRGAGRVPSKGKLKPPGAEQVVKKNVSDRSRQFKRPHVSLPQATLSPSSVCAIVALSSDE